MTAQATWRQRLARMVRQNLGLKVFSLALSVTLFTVVHGSEAGQRSLYVPIVASLPPESSGKILVGEIPDKVKLTLSGSRSVLNAVASIEAVQVDLTDAKRYYYFEAAEFGLPAGIDVQVTPASLALEWEERLERKMRVRPQLAGATDPRFELVGKPNVIPSEVRIQGPRSSVELMGELLTEPISLADLPVGTHRRRVPLLPLPKHVVTRDGADITVELTVEPRRSQRRLKNLAVTPVGSALNVALRPADVDVVLAAPDRVVDEIDPDHLVPVVDLSNVSLEGGAVSVPVTIRGVDDSIRVIRIEPAEILVRLR
jgi:YbbR domain-containing protein